VAKYFFDLYEDGLTILDEEGVELSGHDMVEEQALQASRSLMAEDILSGRLCLSHCIAVRDGSGAIIHRLLYRDAVSIHARNS
jgi:hypothetical protein